jgi:hypothetical protein
MREDGTHLICLQYCYAKAKKIAVGTGIGIPEIYWNKKTSTISFKLPDEFGSHKFLAVQLREQFRKAERIIDYALTKRKYLPRSVS